MKIIIYIFGGKYNNMVEKYKNSIFSFFFCRYFKSKSLFSRLKIETQYGAGVSKF